MMNLTVDVPKRQTALLIVDVQNDFCAANGKMAEFGMAMTEVDKAVDRIEELAAAARQAAVPVIFIRLLTAPETDSKAMLSLYARQGIEASSAAVCRAGTFGAEDYRLRMEPGDYAIGKQRFSAFVGTNIELMLNRLGVTSLIVTGVTTECCVESTVRDGFMRDYETFVVSDACAAYEPELHEMSLKLMALNFATIVSADDVLASWGSSHK
ncbi:isochorismatase [Paenibacillus baekrokdamisoli]|uniref:Isochorismatase n=1 Tax=Paenibacillus baekrokdamisoli TaxID=1712516 RepID=A0A3G9IVZ4_9BACL|nr:isochorismatase family cysteine hydrolase [Paenibacillus baekrokdamisoli]MBB3068497.1 nicotinamidase-related amidase [Paenibacillus baekrokdamisoli]BBH22462.1 isochorismatase [Paenibacillus baekrokdamisoli]